jgi:hypothetical protein
MFTFKSIATSAAIATALAFSSRPTLAQRSETDLWENIGSWQIRIDHTMQNACYVVSYYPRSATILRIGLTTYGQGYFMIGNSNWRSLREGQVVPINIYFGNRPWNANATVKLNIGFPYLMTTIIDFNALTDVAAGTDLVIYYQGSMVGDFSLDNSARAIQSMIECQGAMARTRDPFAVRPYNTDPFAAKPIPTTPTDPFNPNRM